MVELVLRNHQNISWFIRRTGVTCEFRTQHCPCTTGIQQCVCVCVCVCVCLCVCVCVCVWRVPRYVIEVHTNWCLEVLFHFFSHLKEEQIISLNLWWLCETWVYHFTQKCSEHIHLHWQPQNVNCANMLDGCGIYILCYRIRQNCLHGLISKSECERVLWHAVLTALGYWQAEARTSDVRYDPSAQ